MKNKLHFEERFEDSEAFESQGYEESFNGNQDDGAYAYDMALMRFNQLYKQNFQQDEPKGNEIHALLRTISQASTQQFHRNISSPNSSYQNRLKQYLGQKQHAILEVNKQLVEMNNVKILKQCMAPIIEKIQSDGYAGNATLINNDISNASRKFNERAKGESKGDILAEFLTTMNPIVMGIQNQGSKVSNTNQNEETDRLRRQYQMQIDAMQKQISSLKNQAVSPQPLTQPVSQDMKKGAKVNAKNQSITKKQSKGCCGTGDSKCSIM